MKPLRMIANVSPTTMEQGIPKPKKCQCGSKKLTYSEEPSHKKGLIIPYFKCDVCGSKHVKIWWFDGPEIRKPRI